MTTNKRLLDAEKLKEWIAENNHTLGTGDHWIQKYHLEKVVDSGRLDAQSPTPGQDGLMPKITFENHLEIKRRLEKFLLTGELIPIELHRAELKKAATAPPSPTSTGERE